MFYSATYIPKMKKNAFRIQNFPDCFNENWHHTTKIKKKQKFLRLKLLQIPKNS